MENMMMMMNLSFAMMNTTTEFTVSQYKAKIDFHEKTDDLLISYSIMIVVFGVILNLVNFACFYRMKKRNAQNLYLGALSAAEILNIMVNIAVPLLIRLAKNHQLGQTFKNVVHNTIGKRFFDFYCVIYSYLVEVCLHIPVWIMVILSLERFISITWPLRKNIFSTRKQAKRTLFILILVILLWCTFKFKTAGVEEFSTFKEWSNEYEVEQECRRRLTLTTLVNVSTVLWAIVPEFLTLILNLFIIHRIRMTTNLNGKFYSTERTRKITQATRVVLFLSIIFVLLISPTGILIMVEFLTPKQLALDKRLEDELSFTIARKFVLIFYETNMVIHFPIYLLTVKNFKETLKSFMPNISRLKRKDSWQIGVKEDSHSHKQKLGSRVKLDAQSGSNHNINQIINNHNNSESKMNARMKMKSKVENNNSDESVKSHHNSHQYRPVAAAHIKSSSNSSNNTSGVVGACNGCNDNCRLTISFQNKSATDFNKFIKNSFEFGESSVSSRRLRDSAVGAVVGDDARYENSSTRNFSSKIWSWFSLNVNEQAAEEERQSLNKNVAAV